MCTATKSDNLAAIRSVAVCYFDYAEKKTHCIDCQDVNLTETTETITQVLNTQW